MATATAPTAFALSEQYKTQDDESETASTMEDGKTPPRKKGKAPNEKKKRQQKKIPVRLNCLKKRPEKAGCGFDAPGPQNRDEPPKKAEPEAVAARESAKYSPHLYAQKRMIFIQASGLGLKEGSAAWNASSERAALLSTVPLGELKRRKFVPRGCQENPFR